MTPLRERKQETMHYANGREAKNGDKIVQLSNVYSDDGKTLVLQAVNPGELAVRLRGF